MKKIICSQCGYLIFEKYIPDLNGFGDHRYPLMECFKKQTIVDGGYKLAGINQAGRISSELKKLRECKYFKEVIPGLSPRQLLEHELYKEPQVILDRKALRRSTISLCISAIAIIVAIVGTIIIPSCRVVQ